MPTSVPQDEHAIECILEMIEGGASLRKACENRGIERWQFLRWVDSDEDLQRRYAHARARMLDLHAEELEDIGEQAEAASDAVRVAGLRLKSDNRKWLLARLARSKYGDKLELANRHSGTVTHEHGLTAETAALIGAMSVDKSDA